MVDQQYAAELVTNKGKIFTFDAIECLLNFTKEKELTSFAHLLVTDFENPATLIDARNGYYLISENLPSPMGANLTAFSNEQKVRVLQGQKGGAVYTWNELQNYFSSLENRSIIK
nr:nitrous oxide reductase maturation protein, outer-membrane lipoprotein [uncultured bacterium]